MADSSIILHSPENTQPNQAIGKTLSRYTVSQLICYFAVDLSKSSNYPRHAKAFVEDCLKKRFPINGISFARFTAELPPNRVSPIRKLGVFKKRYKNRHGLAVRYYAGYIFV